MHTGLRRSVILYSFGLILTTLRRRWITPMIKKLSRILSVWNRSSLGRSRFHCYPRKIVTDHLTQTTRSYKFSHMMRVLRGLTHSTKTSIRFDRQGIIALQLLMPTPNPRGGISECFVEFRVGFVCFKKIRFICSLSFCIVSPTGRERCVD